MDHGAGVAECDRWAIFEPFWRRRETVPAFGLGLSIVKEIVDLHGGKIAVEDTPGGAATFRLHLPKTGSP